MDSELKPKFTVIPLDNIGCKITATPSAPSRDIVTVALGTEMQCTAIITVNRVPYARVINPSGYMRLNESDGRTPHLEVIERTDTGIADAINRLAAAVERLGDK